MAASNSGISDGVSVLLFTSIAVLLRLRDTSARRTILFVVVADRYTKVVESSFERCATYEILSVAKQSFTASGVSDLSAFPVTTCCFCSPTRCQTCVKASLATAPFSMRTAGSSNGTLKQKISRVFF